MKYTKIMKTFRLFAIIVSLTMISSCKDFLNLAPISSTSVGGFYKTAADFEQAVNGTYASLSGVYSYGYYLLFADLRADNTSMVVLGGGTEQQKISFDNFSLDATNEHMLTFWRVSYQTLQKANGVLTNIDGVTIPQAKKDQYTGESKAIRALVYFNLVRIYGGVPIVTTGNVNIEESYNTKRATVDEVYTLIVADLTDAISLLPETYSGSDIGRVTKGAAQTLLGEVYLTQKKYADAATQLGAVITDANYTLLPAFETNFAAGVQGNSEAVWQILYKGGTADMGSNFPNWCAPLGSDGILTGMGGAYGFNQPTLDIYNAYEAGDLRRDVSIGLGYTDRDGVFIPAKYIKLYVDHSDGDGYLDSDCDWNIYRYSYVLLMCAEALNETNNGPTAAAYTYINDVRSRAGLADLSGLSQSAFRDAVYQEERVEVAFEGHRWFDLIRTDRAITVMNSKLGSDPSTTVGPGEAINANQLLYPIPANVIATSSAGTITQNPGY
jgi:starch-binding outer membrane protein, SusD/RagB family